MAGWAATQREKCTIQKRSKPLLEPLQLVLKGWEIVRGKDKARRQADLANAPSGRKRRTFTELIGGVERKLVKTTTRIRKGYP